MKRIYPFLTITLLLLSCGNSVKDDMLQLLPKPQRMEIDWSQRHKLHNGSVNKDVIIERIVNKIEGADINQEEAYKLIIRPDSILIEATTDKGFYWAKQTLSQLVMQSQKENGDIPGVRITDWPAFRVRGFMHDVGRSFISVEELKKQIALLSQYKINTFHWHLTENQGWRLESKRFPELNDSSSFTRLHGKYYTFEDAHEIAEWCRIHNMNLIPEIDMPGHSAAFIKATGVDMQSAQGMKILKELMEEICTEVFPDVEYIHIGTDEVQFTNPAFVPEMVAYVRSFGKKVISWNPGWNYKPGEIDATQLWSYRGKAQTGIPAIDSRFHYINHFDAFSDIVALYNSRIYDSEQGSDDLAGSILAIWNDRLLPTESDIILQNHFYPNILAFAERAWMGGGSEYFNKNGVILPVNEDDPVLQEFIDFEQRMLWHKENNFEGEPFPYMKQTDMLWRITDPFPNDGDLERTFPPEDILSESYSFNNKEYSTKLARGAGIYLRHVWGQIVPAFFENPEENSTAYAYTWVWSPKNQEVGLWFSTQDYSRSESDLAPPVGEWDYRSSRIWINNESIEPPVWENSHHERSNEITLKNENFVARKPIPVNLSKGWNSVLLKLPVAGFSTPEVRLQKWMFNFMFVTPDGSKRVEELIYNPSKSKKKTINNNIMNIKWNKLSTSGLQGDLSKGVSAAFATTINGKLIVAGGANFPDKLGFEGGTKAFYNEILMYEQDSEEWSVVGKLPTEVAYGVSVPVSNGALWIGGNNSEEAFKTCYHITLASNDLLVLKPFPELPVAMDNFSGNSIGDLVFVAGGNVNGSPSNDMYYINVKTDKEWTKLPGFPGIPRVQPTLAAVEKGGDIFIYLLGGFFGGNNEQAPAMATEVLKFDFSSKEWSKAGEQTDPVSGKPFSLGGAAVMPVDNRYILCLGGVNHDLFLHALTTQYNINNDSNLSSDEKREKNLEFSKVYMTQPIEYYKFNTECRVFDTETGKWTEIYNSPDAARAGATITYDGNTFFVVQGELKPGLRSAETFKVEISL